MDVKNISDSKNKKIAFNVKWYRAVLMGNNA